MLGAELLGADVLGLRVAAKLAGASIAGPARDEWVSEASKPAKSKRSEVAANRAGNVIAGQRGGRNLKHRGHSRKDHGILGGVHNDSFVT